MYLKKSYGQSKIELCPICKKNAMTSNEQGLYVCLEHKNTNLELKCVCGSWLEIKQGNWGPYGNCINCGNVNYKRILETNNLK